MATKRKAQDTETTGEPMRIMRGIRTDHGVMGPGDEQKLNTTLTPEQVEKLVARGDLTGDGWTGGDGQDAEAEQAADLGTKDPTLASARMSERHKPEDEVVSTRAASARTVRQQAA